MPEPERTNTGCVDDPAAFTVGVQKLAYDAAGFRPVTNLPAGQMVHRVDIQHRQIQLFCQRLRQEGIHRRGEPPAREALRRRNRRRLDMLQHQLRVYEHELQYLSGDFSAFDAGEEFVRECKDHLNDFENAEGN